LQDSLFCSTEHPEVNGSGQIDRLLSHVLSRRTTHVHHQVPEWASLARSRSVQLCGLVRGMNACRPRLARALYRSSS
jgi:hypothetical protein